MTENKKHLYYLDELSDYKISDGYPDIRGWSVKDADNRVIGKVDNLLVSQEAERVVYIDVEVDNTIIDANHDPYGRPEHLDVREFVNKDGENHIIVPIGLVELNEDQKYALTETVNHRTFAETKRFSKGANVNREYEVQVLDSYGRDIDTDNYDTNKFVSESRIREIVREEIRKHNERRHDTDHVDADYDERLTEEERERRREVNQDVFATRDRSTDTTRQRAYDVDGDGDTDVLLTDEERDLERRRRNSVVDDEDRFYDREEFDDRRFRRRTPGL